MLISRWIDSILLGTLLSGSMILDNVKVESKAKLVDKLVPEGDLK